MKLSRTDGIKHVTNSDKDNQRLRILLAMYANDVHAARQILGCHHISPTEVNLEQRVTAANIHLRRAINKLRSLGFNEPSSNGYLIYVRVIDAIAELEPPADTTSMQKCLKQLDRRICLGYHGKLVYYDRFVP